MSIHVLPGDALVDKFAETGIDGEIIICRECLIDGDVKADNLSDFWQLRAAFIESAYGEPNEKYFLETAVQLEKLKNISSDAEVNLWFEHELFCQTNMWFCLSLLQETGANVFRVAPIIKAENDFWKGFGNNDADDLKGSFAARRRFEKDDIALGSNLWRAFQHSDSREIERLSQTESVCFPYLAAVCRAAIEIKSRPAEILREITDDKISEFPEIFAEFSRRAGVYGFGDAQVQRILERV